MEASEISFTLEKIPKKTLIQFQVLYQFTTLILCLEIMEWKETEEKSMKKKKEYKMEIALSL